MSVGKAEECAPTPAGVKNLLEDEAVVVGGSNHSHATQDLYDSIAAGDYPEWKLLIQVCLVGTHVMTYGWQLAWRGSACDFFLNLKTCLCQVCVCEVFWGPRIT